MRPIKLVMNAFGSFLETTEIDFEVLNNAGFYLVTGETGSGKTTIFDAIMFALYGVASGNTRDSEGFRNDLADDKNKTYVEFTFMKDGKTYVITRSPKYSLPSRSTPLTEKAELIIGDEVIEKKKAVDEKILEIIGLTVDQFKQVMMLAQGEFMKLIHSDSKKKDEIFRKIFGTEILEELSSLLKEESKTLKDKVTQIETKIHQLIESLNTNNELKYLNISLEDYYNTEYLLEELSEVISTDEEKLNDLNIKLKELQNNQLDLVKQKESASILNDEFDHLNNLTLALENFEKYKDQIEEDKSKISLLNKIDELKPIYEKLLSIHMQINKCIAACKVNQEDLVEKQNELECYKEQENLIDLDRGNLSKAKETALLIKNDIDLKEKVNKLNDDVLKVKNDLDKNEEKLSTLNETKRSLEEEINKLNNDLKDLEDIKTKYELSKSNLEKVNDDFDLFNEKIKDLTKRNTIKNDILVHTTNYQKLAVEYQNLLNEYIYKESSYYNNIAGILVKELKDGHPCPVCGSTTHPSIAKVISDAVTKDELEELDKKKELARNVKDEEKIKIEKLYVKCDELNNKLLELLNISDVNLIENTIDTTLCKMNENKVLLQEELKNKIIELQNLENTKKLLSLKETEIENLNIKINEYTNHINSLKEQLATLNGSITTYQEQMSYEESIDELNEAFTEYSDFIEMMEEQINGFDNGYKIANEEYKIAAVKLEESNKQLNELKDNYERLTLEYNDLIASLSLSNNVVDNLEEYIQELPKLSEYIKKVTEFETRYDNTKNTIKELTLKLDGKQKINILLLDEQILKLENELIILSRSITELYTKLTNNKQVNKELEKQFKLYIKTSNEFNELNELSKTSNGNNVKYLSFERYVLIEYFENILKHANIRLSKMTDGRFALYRKEDKGKGSAQQGLELEVFDFETGKRRDVKTLSGGETFKAALSLALGLADAIENKVGHISIETLFIDEGFGTLDEKSLHQAIDILLELNDGSKSIGIISHVQELKDIIPTKLVVTKTTDGSKVKIIA